MAASRNPFLIQDAAGRGHGGVNPPPAPLFLIHDASGNIFSYLKLGFLGGGRRVYGISDPHFGRDGGTWQSVDDMARHYLKLIKKVTLRGNVLLGGWSFGGIVAIQMAHLLAAEGRGLACAGLLLIDTVHLSPARSLGSGANFNSIAPSMPASMALGTRDEILASLVRANVLCSSWRPPSWAGRKMPRAVLVKATDPIPPAAPRGPADGGAGDSLCRLDALRDRADLGWGETQPGLVVGAVLTPGHHYALFADENIFFTTESLKQALSRLEGEDQ